MYCPRCAAVVGPEQDWCLQCGLAARTRLAPTPPWQLPVVALATLATIAVLALGVAFVIITGDDENPATTTAPATAPAATPPVPAPTATATTPTATTPPTTTPSTTTTTTRPRTTAPPPPPPPATTTPGPALTPPSIGAPR